MNKVTTYKQAFEVILDKNFDEKLQTCVKYLEKEGYEEKNIAYVIWKVQEKLSIYKGDPRFCSILQNEVRKNGLTKSQWQEYWKNKHQKS